MAKINYREASKTNWFGEFPDGQKFPGIDYINMASMQRIADATEAMAANHIKLQNDYNYMKESRDAYRDRCNRLENRIRTMKGVITKLKKKHNANPTPDR